MKSATFCIMLVAIMCNATAKPALEGDAVKNISIFYVHEGAGSGTNPNLALIPYQGESLAASRILLTSLQALNFSVVTPYTLNAPLNPNSPYATDTAVLPMTVIQDYNTKNTNVPLPTDRLYCMQLFVEYFCDVTNQKLILKVSAHLYYRSPGGPLKKFASNYNGSYFTAWVEKKVKETGRNLYPNTD